LYWAAPGIMLLLTLVLVLEKNMDNGEKGGVMRGFTAVCNNLEASFSFHLLLKVVKGYRFDNLGGVSR
jgi:hypothetical protein